MITLRRSLRDAVLIFVPFITASATTIPRVSFDQLVDGSDFIVSGRITQSWMAWDAGHQYIWTHYVLSVSDAVKGERVSAVEFAEPGGAVAGASMLIAGSVAYSTGDNVLVFLSRMPNGYLRTTGWSQGKYALDAAGRLHGAALGTEVVDTKSAAAGASPHTLEGMSLTEFRLRVRARVRAAMGSVQ